MPEQSREVNQQVWWYGSLTLEGGAFLIAASWERRGERLTVCETKFVTQLSNLVRLEWVKAASIGIVVNNDAKDFCNMAKIFELEELMKSVPEKLNVIEMSNENQVINVDREDDSAISCVEAKCTVHLILVTWPRSLSLKCS